MNSEQRLVAGMKCLLFCVYIYYRIILLKRHCERSVAILNYTVSKLYIIMVFQRGGCVYIVTNKEHSVLYKGITSDIISRTWEHKNKAYPNSFSAKV